MPDFLDLHGKTNKALRALAEAAMQRHGLHLGQDHLLALLWARDGQSPTQVAAAANVATPTVVKMASRMAAAGLLTKRSDLEDNRLVRLWLTAAGRRLQGPVEAERASLEAKVTAALTTQERARLMASLAKVCRSSLALLDSPSVPPKAPTKLGLASAPAFGGPKRRARRAKRKGR
jgi:DNA-binding MarR family transcriptional regulator